MILDEETYLEHYGKKGMKWGERKAAKQNKLENKAKKYDDRAKVLRTRIKETDARLVTSNRFQRRGLNRDKKELSEKLETAVKDAELKRQGKLSTGQKKMVIGASVTIAILGAYGAANLASSGEFHRKAMQGKSFMKKNATTKINWDFDPNSGRIPIFKVNQKLAKTNLDENAIMSNIVSKINPDFGKPGTLVNCRRATFAYEMRRRGYDVAATRTNTGRGQVPAGMYNAMNPKGDIARAGASSVATRTLIENVKKSYGITDKTPFTDALDSHNKFGKNIISSDSNDVDTFAQAKGIFSTLAKQPDRSRGELGIGWEVGGGHSIAYEVIKGKPVLFDTQSGKKMSDYKDFMINYKDLGVSESAFTRLDNVDLNQNFLQRWVKDA